MATRKRFTVIEDVGGHLERLFREAPKVMREELAQAVKVTTASLAISMTSRAPVGPDAPHIKDDIEAKSRGLSGRAGIIDDDEQAHIALYNEYGPNQNNAFMLPAANAQESYFRATVTRQLQNVERRLSIGGL